MKKIKTLLADTDNERIKLLSRFLKENHNIQVIGTVLEPRKLEAFIQVHNPDVLFMNFSMQEYPGLDWLKNLREYNLNLTIVLLTKPHDNLEEAINYQIFSTLPVSFNADDVNLLVNKLCLHLDIRDTNEKIKLPVKDGFLFLNHSEILILEAEGNYTRIFTTLNDEYVSSYNMGRLYKKLDPDKFFRINRHCILNSDYLRKIDKKNNVGIVHVNGVDKEVNLSNTFIAYFNKNFS